MRQTDTTRYGLSEETIAKISGVFAKHPRVEKAVLYGSRAKGAHKPGSDIDLTLYAADLPEKEKNRILDELDELDLPYTIDLSLFHRLSHAKLREHIERVGVVFYRRDEEDTPGKSSGYSGRDRGAGRGERGGAGGDSGGAVKAGWATKTLGDIADIKGGKRVPKGYKLQTEPTKNPYITISDFTEDGTISTTNLRYVSSDIFEQIKRYTISSKDLYISIAGTIGKTGYVPPELDGASLTENACKLVLRPNVDRDFVYYFTKSDDFARQAGTNTRTAAQPKLALERLKTIKLRIPVSLPEQRRIVAILDDAFDAIATAKANAEKNLKNARELFESHLQAVFAQRGEGWVEKRLDEIGTTQTGSTPKFSEKESYGAFIPFIKPADFNTDGSLVYDKDGLSEAGLQRARVVKAYSVLMVCIGATIGKTGFSDRDVTTNQQINALTPRDEISHKFLYYHMITDDFQRRVMDSSAQATLPIINKSRWSSLTANFPPAQSEQKRLVATLDALLEETQRLASLYQQKLAALDELKKSLLHKAFAGEL